MAVQTMTISESTQLFGNVLSKDVYGQRFYYDNADSGISIQHGQPNGTISLGYFGTVTASASLYRSTDDTAVLSLAYGSLTSDLAVGRDAQISGAASVGSSLNVGSDASITGNVTVGTNLMVNATITGSTLQVVGPFASISGNVSVGTSLFVRADASITGGLLVGATATISGNLTVGTDLSVLGSATITNNLGVLGSADVGSNLTVHNNGSFTNTLFADHMVANFGSVTNLTAGHAMIMNDLVVEGNTSYINTSVSTFQDLNIQFGLNHVKTVVGTQSGGTFLLNGGEDAGISAVPVGAFAYMNGPDQFTSGTNLGQEPLLKIATSSLDAGTYSVTFTKWEGGSETAVQSITDLGFPSSYDVTQTVTTLGQVADAAFYGKAGMSFSSYGTTSSGAFQNNSKALLFGDHNNLNALDESKEVVDLNLMGVTRDGVADTPYYKVNGNAILNPNNLVLDTTFSTSSAIYLNASSTTTSQVGTWRMRVNASDRLVFERLSTTGWKSGLNVTSPF